ncbi:uncharacterized protein [Panulirus ornatus]
MRPYLATVEARVLLLLAHLLVGVVHGLAHDQDPYHVDRCYCFSDGYDDTIWSAITAFTNPPKPDPYHYTGAKYQDNNQFIPCFCSDVTRVITLLKVTENVTVEEATDSAARLRLTTNVTRQLNELLESMKETQPGLNHTLISFTANCNVTVTTTFVPCDVEALLRGHNASLKDDVSQALKETLSSGTLVGVGTVDSLDMTFTVPQCTDEPRTPPTHGQMTFTSKLTGASATYTCDPGYGLSTETEKEVSVCDHEKVTWTSIPHSLNCMAPHVPDKGCTDSPPAKPDHASYDWNGHAKEEGTVVKYTCLIGYKPTEKESQTSTCKDKEWTKISSTFKCEYNGCIDNPPQVPDNAKLDFTSRADGSWAIYTCRRNYRTIGTQPKLQCKNKTWSELPEDFKCVKNDGSYISEEEIIDDSSYLV